MESASLNMGVLVRLGIWLTMDIETGPAQHFRLHIYLRDSFVNLNFKYPSFAGFNQDMLKETVTFYST